MCDSENNSHLLYQIEPLKTVQFCVSNSKWRNCLCFYHTDFSTQNAYQYSTDTLKILITHGNEITYLSTQQIIPPLMKNFFPLPASVLFCAAGVITNILSIVYNKHGWIESWLKELKQTRWDNLRNQISLVYHIHLTFLRNYTYVHGKRLCFVDFTTWDVTTRITGRILTLSTKSSINLLDL